MVSDSDSLRIDAGYTLAIRETAPMGPLAVLSQIVNLGETGATYPRNSNRRYFF
jgi:hypothetical protein